MCQIRNQSDGFLLAHKANSNSSRRIGRLNKSRHIGMPDQRDYAGMKGAMRAPYNQYDFMAGVKKMMQSRGQSFNVVRAGGFIPNFASEAFYYPLL